MDTNVLNSKWLWLAIASLAAISGCCCEAYPLPGECDCPTDARRLYLGTGEEAVRRCPCGPDREYFGLKPTCWRRWPDGWGCGRCDHPSSPDGSCGEAVGEERALSSVDGSNPFRSKEWEDEHRAPAVEATSPPARVPPAVNAPAQAAPVQSAPLKSAPPELFPLEKALPPIALRKTRPRKPSRAPRRRRKCQPRRIHRFRARRHRRPPSRYFHRKRQNSKRHQLASRRWSRRRLKPRRS